MPRLRLAGALAAVAIAVTSCATVGPPAGPVSAPPPPVVLRPDRPLECVPFARAETGIAIFGDASTWWAQAAGRYPRSDRPIPGGVMVLRGYADLGRGHVSVVRAVLGPRDILVDHANWLNSGEISRNVPVRDVSAAGDWSAVRVWHVPGSDWGARIYSVQGFIGR